MIVCTNGRIQFNTSIPTSLSVNCCVTKAGSMMRSPIRNVSPLCKTIRILSGMQKISSLLSFSRHWLNPATTWKYCNTNYFLLGMIIRRATGYMFYMELRNGFYSARMEFHRHHPETVSSPVAHAWMDITGDGVTDDAHSFYYNLLSLNSAGGAAGLLFQRGRFVEMDAHLYAGEIFCRQPWWRKLKPRDCSRTRQRYLRTWTHAKIFPRMRSLRTGGDLTYSASSWYFPDFDISISVLSNESTVNSWGLIPVVTALLQTYLNWNLVNR